MPSLSTEKIRKPFDLFTAVNFKKIYSYCNNQAKYVRERERERESYLASGLNCVKFVGGGGGLAGYSSCG